MADRQARILNKLMTGTRGKERSNWFQGNVIPKTKNLASTHGESKGASRRVVVLNRLFMGHITDQLATSRFQEEIHGFGIEISHVRVCQKFSELHVYWYTTAHHVSVELIEKRLAEIAFPLRHVLSQLRLIGEFPRITFIQDRKLNSLKELDNVFATADFGEDHVPNPYGQRVKKEFEPQLPDVTEAEEEEEDMIPMRHDVFGIDRRAIMARITTSMAKTKSAWDAYEKGAKDPGTADAHPGSTIDSLRDQASDVQKSEDVLQDFLAKRKSDNKVRKTKMSSVMNESEEEIADRLEWQNDNDDDYSDDEDDYDAQRFSEYTHQTEEK